ncbi:PINc/VapC family ATPase [Archaeoglobus profundus]|uniref:PilT protein domain protein n=1 Tax=Archaeoglobus profundus (strain DSM 5631 / JCM 9629 / NBRC 100127 / Av18) TaxID=572546 RepID=D2REP5_ARCPA|nr:PINc/VapC family ATPase [Archaeoglobus profundus]ADB58589.1 PilT protein domain protein [Archaeoglobus profundus DSM 5631]
MKYVIDTSALIDGRVSKMLENGEIAGTIIIPEPAIAELEAQANRGKMTGFKGLEEIKKIREIAEQKGFDVIFLGERPSIEQIRLAKSGEIDNMIRRIAEEEKAILITCDRVQYYVAVAKGIDAIYLQQEVIKPEETNIMKFFTPDTASVHLREGVPPLAKRGKIGQLKLVKIRDEPMTLQELQEIAHEILEVARIDEDSNIEIERKGCTVVQLRDLRIAIAERPFADRMEITAVRPIAKVTLDEYGISEELKRRIVEKQRGILIAGPPGAGKSTFAASVANYLMEMGHIVKTMESPRDLIVRDEITQYAPLEGDMSLTSDILLLVRPDYTIYDELRRTSDFQVFADMRLAGVGMIGVTHATRAIDAIQRLIGRVELGIIPQVVDTVIFIDAGQIKKVYELNFTVKVPYGMTEEDLARPVIEVIDFETKRVEYEIYTYGEQVVVMPIEEENLEEIKKMIEDVIRRYVSRFEVEVLSNTKAIVKVPEDDIPRLLGRRGRRIKNIEKELKIKLDVQPLYEEVMVEAKVEEDTKHYIIHAKGLEGRTVEIYANNDYLFTVAVSRKGTIKIRKDKEAGKMLKEALLRGEKIYIKYRA